MHTPETPNTSHGTPSSRPGSLEALRKLPPDRARELLEAVGASGQPPERGALLLNVGTTDLLEAIDEAHLEQIVRNDRLSTFKLVMGSYGDGKTQLLSCLLELAWRRGFACAYIPLSPENGAFHTRDALYRRIAEAIALAPESPDAEPARGLPALLDQWLAARRSQVADEDLAAWIDDELSSASVVSPSYLAAVVAYLKLGLGGTDGAARERRALLRSWLLGAPVRGSRQRAALAEMHVYDKLDRDQALQWIVSLTQVVRALDLPGTLLLFDEGDRFDSLSKGQKTKAVDNLRAFVDLVASKRLRGVFAAYATTPGAYKALVGEYPALQQRLMSRRPATPRTPEVPLIRLDGGDQDLRSLLEELGERLLLLAMRAYPRVDLHPEAQRENLRRLAELAVTKTSEEGPLRAFVRAAYQMLLDQREAPSVLDEHELEVYLGRSSTQEAYQTAPLPGELGLSEHAEEDWDDEDQEEDEGDFDDLDGEDRQEDDDWDDEDDDWDDEEDDEDDDWDDEEDDDARA